MTNRLLCQSLVALLLLAGCMTPDVPVDPDPYEVFHCLEPDDFWHECEVVYATATSPGRLRMTRVYACAEGYDVALLRIVHMYDKRIPMRHIMFKPTMCWASATPPFMN